ncbi:hypothetical protein N7488_011951 [Penicillium malachiteum]|nr:hypothetical protein N7488_011951 [Penicillium malachiteum]
MPAPIQLPSPVPSNETTSTGTQTTGPALPSARTTGTPNERDALRIRFGTLIAKDNTAPARNDSRAGPGPVARERIETPANQLQRPRYLDHDAWRKAANEYEAEPANQLCD